MMQLRMALAAFLIIGGVQVADAYSHFTVNAAGLRLRWQPQSSPEEVRARWFVTDRGVPGVSAADLQRAVEAAFATWQAVPTATIGGEFAGFVAAEPFEDDGLSVFGFQDHPEMERVLGATTFVVDILTGEIVEADVFLNAAFLWSTAPGGDAARFDVESVALHEIGHVLGLAHSAVGETELLPDGARRVIASGAVMFPIALGRGSIVDRALTADDVAGISDLYPAPGFRDATGVVRGRVLRSGAPALGAHVVAFNPSTRALIGGFALGVGGAFQIAGLTPGAHVIRVEPLDDADLESFFSGAEIEIDFLVTYHPHLFVAPQGGVGEHIDIPVRLR